ncbi:MAG: hypothetical protein WA160_04575 [Pseudobdellovibrio sp.]
MSKSLIITSFIFLIQMSAFAQSNTISKVYSDYKNKKNLFFASDLTQANIKAEINSYLKTIDNNYEAITTLESKNSEIELSIEGNQMAYDRELLQPLIDFSLSSMNNEACAIAIHDNKLNAELPIELILKKICKI